MDQISHLVQSAIRHFQAGEGNHAESLCHQALGLDPGEINALHLLGLIALQNGKPDQAIEFISTAINRNGTVSAFYISLGNAFVVNGKSGKAIAAYQQALKLDSGNPVAHNNLANTYTQQRQMEQARMHYQYALDLQPDYAPARLGLGNILNTQGQHDKAAEYYQQALSLLPTYPEAHCYLGVILRNKGQTHDAIEHFEQALAQRPNYADALINLGNALQDDRQFDAAIENFRRYLNIHPDDADCHYNLGNSFYLKGETGEAISQFEQAVAINPDFYQAHSNLGNALYHTGQYDRALKHLEHAIELAPDYADAHNNMACLLKDTGCLQKAIYHFEQALVYRADFTEVYNNMGVTLHALGRTEEALSYYEKALQLQPDKAEVYGNMGVAFHALGRLDEELSYYEKELHHQPDKAYTFSNMLLALNYSTDYDAEAIFTRHRQYAERFESQVTKVVQSHPNNPEPEKRLRVGYVSPDFRDHAVAYFIEPVLANHAHDKFEIFCYYNHIKNDKVTQRLQRTVKHWRNIVAMSDDEVVRLIQEDRIDILVDLAGHTALNRLPVFARKPAPVQVTWLGYLNTTGLKSMDYRITDSYASPPGKFDQYSTETLIRMPDSQWCYQPPLNAPEVNALPARNTGHITFGSFHTLAKITPLVTRLWSEVLNAVPDARLLMVARGLEQQETKEEIQSRFDSVGVEARRIDFIGSQSFENYLRLHHRVDINLDTSPYTGGTTTCHSLWMGVPIITLAGDTATSRGGTSLLNAMGLTDLVAHTEDEYVDIARHLANNLDRLYSMRTELRTLMASSPLTNGEQFTYNLEHAYRKIWTDWCQEHFA